MKSLSFIFLFICICVLCKAQSTANTVYGNPVNITSRTNDTTSVYLKTATKNINGIAWNIGGGKIGYRLPLDSIIISNDSVFYQNVSGYKYFKFKIGGSSYTNNDNLDSVLRRGNVSSRNILNVSDVGGYIGVFGDNKPGQVYMKIRNDGLSEGGMVQFTNGYGSGTYLMGDTTSTGVNGREVMLPTLDSPRFAITQIQVGTDTYKAGNNGKVSLPASGGGSTDTSHLSARINLKVDSVTANGDSSKLSYWVNGTEHPFFNVPIDSASISPYTLDSTGQPAGKIPFTAYDRKYHTSNYFLYDSTNRKVVIGSTNISVYGNATKLAVIGRAQISGILTAGSFKTPTGTSSDLLLADGSTNTLKTVNGNSLFGSGDISIDAVPSSRTITINGTTFDLSANRSWTVTATETDPLALKIANDFSDLHSVSTARTNLGLGSFATLSNPATTNQDLLVWNGSTYSRLGIGSDGSLLGVVSGNLAFTTIGITDTLAHTIYGLNLQGTTVTKLTLADTTPATSSITNQVSPSFVLEGRSWNGSSSYKPSVRQFVTSPGGTNFIYNVEGSTNGTSWTNFLSWSSSGSVLTIGNQAGVILAGTAKISNITSAAGNSALSLNSGGAGVSYSGAGNNSKSVIAAQSTSSQTSGSFIGLYVNPTYNQTSSTTSNYDISGYRTETSVGSGVQREISLGVGTTENFGVDNKGVIYVASTTTPAPAIGYATIWFDGTNIKMTKNVSGTTTTSTIF